MADEKKQKNDSERIAGYRAAANKAGYRAKTLWLFEAYRPLIDQLMRSLGWATASARAALADRGQRNDPHGAGAPLGPTRFQTTGVLV